MLVLILSVVVLLVIGGCVCVFWAARGTPRAGCVAWPPRPSSAAS